MKNLSTLNLRLLQKVNYAMRQANYGSSPLRGECPGGADDCRAISPEVFEEEAQKLGVDPQVVAIFKDALMGG